MLPPRRELERAAAASWPAAVAERAPGWLLRATPGAQGRRLNSALPDPEPGPIEAVESWYGEAPLVQVAPAQDHLELDAELERRGWAAEAPTAVLAAPARRIAGSAPGVEVVSEEAWLPAWRGVGETDDRVDDGVLARITAPKLPLVARVDDAVAGVALAVLQPGASIVFGVGVSAAFRRCGIATALMRAWANAAGDRTLFLQVLEDNAAGLALYDHLGFARSHGYHYRRGPSAQGSTVGGV